MIRYYVCGIGYDENNCVTDYECDFGDFDAYEEAYECFVKVQCSNPASLFSHNFASYQMLIQLEECEETDNEIHCIDVKNEWWITNPKFKATANKTKEEYKMLKVPKNKIMMALLDEEYYFKHKSYPEEYDSRYAHESYVFDTPQEFIEKWYEIDEGAWYWVFDNGEVICSGAVDPNDIETFEEHFNMTFEEEFGEED